MSRTKGTPKTGGRGKGTPNKVTGTLKEFIGGIIDENRERIKEDLELLEPKDRLLVLEKLMQYVIPKQKEMDVKGITTDHVTIEYVDAGIPLAHSEDEIVD